MSCKCGREFKAPALFVGWSKSGIPVVLFHCECGQPTYIPFSLPKPFVAEKGDVFPPVRGKYGISYVDVDPVLFCPLCATPIPIKAPHAIADDGKVTPPVICLGGCGFHAQVVLDDWGK